MKFDKSYIEKMINQEAGKNIVEAPNFCINNNVLSFSDNFIQFSNVSKVSIAPVESIAYPKFLFILLVIGLALMSIENLMSTIVGLLFIAISIFVIYTIYQLNQTRGDYLQLQLNSGTDIWFKSKDRSFLKEIIDVLKKISNDRLNNVFIDFENSIVSVGDNNDLSIKK